MLVVLVKNSVRNNKSCHSSFHLNPHVQFREPLTKKIDNNPTFIYHLLMLLRGVIQLSHPNKTQQNVRSTSAYNTTGHLLLENGCGGRCKKLRQMCFNSIVYVFGLCYMQCKDSLYDGFDISLLG